MKPKVCAARTLVFYAACFSRLRWTADSDLQHNLTSGMPFPQHRKGLCAFLEGENTINHQPQSALLNQISSFRQLRTIWFHDKEDASHIREPRLCIIREWRSHTDHHAPNLDIPPALIPRLPAHTIKHNIKDALDLFARIVNDPVRAQTSDELRIPRGARPCDTAHAQPPRELDRYHADTAGCSQDQDGLIGSSFRVREKSLPRRKEGQGQSGSLGIGQPLRFPGQFMSFGNDVLGCGAIA